jgi:hypothetical protein
MAENAEKKAGDRQERSERKPQVKAEHREAAKLASNPEARNEAGEKALAEQLAQQDAAREENGVADVIPEDEAPIRAAHAGEGGGAWPMELLEKRSIAPVGALVSMRPEELYTSHEDAEK